MYAMPERLIDPSRSGTGEGDAQFSNVNLHAGQNTIELVQMLSSL